jgi:rhamnosyltransferase
MSTIADSISVLIRTRDVESHFYELLLSLSCQTLRPSELVVVDNYSNSNKLKEMTVLLTKAKKEPFGGKLNIMIVPLTDEEFSHAYSANAGVSVSSRDFVCITNGHCLPTSNEWLESAAAHFKDEDVVGVAGYTLPHKEGTIWEKLAFDWGWRKLNEASKAYNRDTYFSTTNCVIRRTLWEEYPFDEKIPDLIPEGGRFGGEDYDWSLEMLARGHRLIVEPKFDVYHSHGETLSQLVPKYLAWRKIRKNLRSFTRPRDSFTRLKGKVPQYYIL